MYNTLGRWFDRIIGVTTGWNGLFITVWIRLSYVSYIHSTIHTVDGKV